MEPVSVAISVASLASVFQTCIAAYNGLTAAIAIGDTALSLEIRFRVEGMRLNLWGKSRGLTNALNGDRRVNSLLEIREMRRLILDILGRIAQLLEKHIQVSQKYRALADPHMSEEVDDSSSLTLPKVMAAKGRLDDRIADVSKRTSIGAKIRWALQDKNDLTALLSELTALNDGLERLLPEAQARALSQSLAAEILSNTPTLPQISEGSFGVHNRRAATIIQLRQQNKTSLAEPPQSTASQYLNNFSTPAAANEQTGDKDRRAEGDWVIPVTSFRGFVQPRLHDLQGGIDGVLEGPNVRTVEYYVPNTSELRGQNVLVEWRSQHAESKNSSITPEALSQRHEHLVRLLHRTSMTSPDFRVLNCLGYTYATGRLPDGKEHPVVGFVYEMPSLEGESSAGSPTSLREILGEAYQSQEPKVPDLNDRFALAYNLSLALYQLHCAGWIHRKISSHNILYFKSPHTGTFDVTKPYVSGWQYARPDHHVAPPKPGGNQVNFVSEVSGAGRITGLGDLAMYIHPDRLESKKGIPRFRKGYDIYSFGVLLIEIAFWEPILVFADPSDRELMRSFKQYESVKQSEWVLKFTKAAHNEIGSEMGARYKCAVLTCLKGLDSSNKVDDDNLDLKDMNGLEPGIEKEFFWRIVEELRRYTEIMS
ncbi:prion-inhibition and propagation-domain-containing protein [Aspergillus carlsbadensis]|nr:prion-inhibition and propagation-domain-containing protein [Aspergillus carlsbadensis]